MTDVKPRPDGLDEAALHRLQLRLEADRTAEYRRHAGQVLGNNAVPHWPVTPPWQHRLPWWARLWLHAHTLLHLHRRAER